MTRCTCGRYYISPVPTKCSRCGADLPDGSSEGDMFRIIQERSLTILKTMVIDTIYDGDTKIEFLSDWGNDTGNVPRVVTR